MAAPAHIFVSYAHSDGADLARRLVDDFQRAGLHAWLDTSRLVGGACWTTEIEQAIDESQVVIALLTNGSYNSDICRAEQLRALRKHKHVIPVLARQGSEIPLHLEAKHYRDFTGTEPYSAQLEGLVTDILERKGNVPLREEFRHTYVTAPPLPRNYVERPHALESLRAVLITDGGGPSVALTALKGMGGIGKTVLAQAICHDQVIQQAFPDGVIWVTAGRESVYDLITRMREVRRALNDNLAIGETELECINRYRNVIREKAALVVVDDVWVSRDIEPFRAESPRSRILFTTRDASIAAAIGAEEHIADLLTEDQSRDVLARWSGVKANALPPDATDLIRECGRLPLALSMIGAMLRGKPREYWRHIYNLLRGDDLGKIRTDFPHYAHKDLLRAMQVSVDGLDSKVRGRYFALAVLLEDMPVHPALQQALWSADELDALDTAERLVSLSLAQRDGHDRGIRLHDLQLDYLRSHYDDKSTLHLIQGAVRLSSLTIEKDPYQFVSQIIGRLLPHLEVPEVQRFTSALVCASRRPLLRLLSATLHPPGTGLVQTLEGHSASINRVAITPDGLRAVSASWDNNLKVWDLESGRELHTLFGHSASVTGVAISPDGLYAISSSEDDTLRLWDLSIGREIRILIGHGGSVTGVAILPDGCRAISASWDKTLKVWDLESGRALQTLKGHSASVTGLAVFANGLRAISASADHTLKVWNLESGGELHTLVGHSDVVFDVTGFPDETRAVSASRDQSLKIWELESGRELRTLKGHSDFVYGAIVSPDGHRVVSASRDKTLKVWEPESGRELHTLKGHSASVTSVTVTPDGRRVVSSSWDKTLKIWELESGSEIRTIAGHSGFVSSVAGSQDGRFGVSASWDGTLKVWHVASGHELRTFVGHRASVDGVAVTQNGKLVVSASLDTTLKVWDLESARELRTLVGHTNAVSGVAVTLDGRLAVSASRDNTLKIWDLESGRELRTLAGHSDGVTCVAVTSDGLRAVSASVDKTLKLWELLTGRELCTLQGHSQLVSGVAITPDGQRAVSSSWDNTIEIWDLESGRNVRALRGHLDRVAGVAVSADGLIVVSASIDKSVRVWELLSGKEVAAFTCDSPAYCCNFVGSRIIAGDQNGRVHFLTLEPGR
jgi:WD40 repeat protein